MNQGPFQCPATHRIVSQNKYSQNTLDTQCPATHRRLSQNNCGRTSRHSHRGKHTGTHTQRHTHTHARTCTHTHSTHLVGSVLIFSQPLSICNSTLCHYVISHVHTTAQRNLEMCVCVCLFGRVCLVTCVYVRLRDCSVCEHRMNYEKCVQQESACCLPRAPHCPKITEMCVICV
jgi:hypothetical protein